MPPRRQQQRPDPHPQPQPLRSSSTSPPPLPAKRKATDDHEHGAEPSKKKPKQARAKAGGKSNGEQVAGGLFIVRGAPQLAPAPPPAAVPPPPPRRPARRSSPAPKETKPASKKATAGATRGAAPPAAASKAAKGKGKGKALDQDESNEEVESMEKELSDLTAAGRDQSRRAGPSSPQTDLTFAPRKSYLLPAPPSPSSYRPPPAPSNEFLEASSSQDSIQPLPIRDTPMISKNREMRKEAQGRRRSSWGMRGRRSSGAAADATSQPHPSIPHATFYKHMSPDDPPAMRMRGLLQWCSYRAGAAPVPSPPTSKSRRGKEKKPPASAPEPALPALSEDADKLLKEVQEDVFRLLATSGIDTSVFSKLDAPVGEGGKKLRANEQNVRNRERDAADQLYFEQCRHEESAWSSLIQSYNTIQSTVVKSLSARRKSQTSLALNLEQLDERSRAAARAADDELREESGRSEQELDEKFAALQLKVDTLHQSAHVLSQLAQRADTHLSSYLVTLQSRHQARTAPLPPLTAPLTLSSASANSSAPLSGLLSAVRPDARETAAGGRDDPQLLLKALAGEDVQRQRKEEQGDEDAQRRREEVADRRVTAVPRTPRRQPGTPGRRSTRGRGRG